MTETNSWRPSGVLHCWLSIPRKEHANSPTQPETRLSVYLPTRPLVCDLADLFIDMYHWGREKESLLDFFCLQTRSVLFIPMSLCGSLFYFLLHRRDSLPNCHLIIIRTLQPAVAVNLCLNSIISGQKERRNTRMEMEISWKLISLFSGYLISSVGRRYGGNDRVTRRRWWSRDNLFGPIFTIRKYSLFIF